MVDLPRNMRENRSRAKISRYFGVKARNLDKDSRVPRLQLWRGDKRKDHMLSWHAATTPSNSEGNVSVPRHINKADEETRVSSKASPDFLPVDPDIDKLDTKIQEDEDGSSKVHNLSTTETLEQWITRRTKEFNELTREQPYSAELWLRYADFQVEAVRAVHGGGGGESEVICPRGSEQHARLCLLV